MTKLDGRAPTILTEWGARRLTARIRDALAVADDLLVQAFTGRAWEALGYDSFARYCEGELPELQFIKLRTEARRARVAALHAEGATRTELVAATGASRGAVQADVVALTGRTAAPRTGPRLRSKTDRAVAALIAAGPRGLDVRQVTDKLGCERHEASATLTRLERAGRVAYEQPERRGLFGKWVVSQ